LHADPTKKLEALITVARLTLSRGRLSAPDNLIGVLNDVQRPHNYAE
jgi:hypothetical protein